MLPPVAPLDGGLREMTAERQFIRDMALGLRDLAGVEERPRFRSMIERINPSLLNFEHIPRLVDVFQRIADGELLRVIILEPPRYFKTEVTGRLFPAYLLDRDPNVMIGLSSYGAELAWTISEEAREYFLDMGGALRRSTAAKRNWRTMAGGRMWAAGAAGPIMGFGFDYGIIDDPQDPERAWSPVGQKSFERWWPQKWMSRAEPGAAVVVTMQRLGPGDAIDFLLRREVGEDTDLAPEHWHVVLCDEVRSTERVGRWDGPLGLPETCTLEPDPRERGEILSPSRFNAAQVKSAQQSAGPFITATQRQQRPSAPEGDFWKLEWFENLTYDVLPDDAYNLGWDWDLAYSKEERNRASAGIQSARGPGKPLERLVYIEDVAWDWLEFPEMVAFIKARIGPHYIENKASGKSAEQALKREGIAVKTVNVQGDKLARATGVQTVASNLRVRVNRRVLRTLLQGDRQGLLNIRAEDLAVSRGDLDLNDTFVQALTRHVGRRGKRVRAMIPGQLGEQQQQGGKPVHRPPSPPSLSGNSRTRTRIPLPTPSR